MSHIEIRSSNISKQNVLDLMDMFDNVVYVFDNKNTLVIERTSGEYACIGNIEHYQVFFGEHDHDDDGKECYMVCQSQYFPMNELGKATECFIARLVAEQPMRAIGTSYKLEDIKIMNGGKLIFESHYNYLDTVIEKFWMKVFGKTLDESWCSGIVVSHGDKCYQYKHEWNEADIAFHHGALLFLLTYTCELGDTPKHLSCQWVIDNYAKYKPIIDAVEEEVLLEKYGVKPIKR